VGPGASLDTVEKRKFLILPRLELRPLGQTRNERLWIARDSKVYCHELDDDTGSAVDMEGMEFLEGRDQTLS
jgi:hypothetical protein